MQSYFNKVTQAGYDQIAAEIEALKQSRPEKIEQLQAARALGDLSENAEYSAAKRDLRHLESRLRYLGKQLRYAQVVKPKDDAVIEIGKQVVLQFMDDQSEDTFELVGTPEADVGANKISLISPIGKAILDHTVGDVVSIDAPNGAYQVKILDVTL
ncbi:transcription elongation factor GreA [Secundilactobacillus paracollinoides]|uniref:transcription elongation factor GreA n=1 Tax=Secundilactobacillus paracollinoides TaxID=240427 RepID=UPI0006D00410|nr:transcription elongation factor GreA [Secundilactobacillus paracollinoides]ANZ64578.1 transcription elongation factor GreA [Secundilactobacillus paracollinoides]KRL76970.1 transcription elongation factor GreA [Secundilactobacillus paracollinoides DSM 15502 = JCM 11969]